MIWVAALKSFARRFFVTAKAIPVAASQPAKLPPTPPTPNAVLVSPPGTPIEYPSAQVVGMPKTSSTPLTGAVVASRRRSGERSRTPSTSPSNAAYIRAMARADVLPPAGMSAARVSSRLPNAAFGISDMGAALNMGRSGGIAGIWKSGGIGVSSSTASLWCSERGMPKYSSFSHAKRNRKLLAQHLRDGLAGHAADDLADDIAEGVGVVADLGAGLPPRLRVGDGRAHLVPVAEVFDRRRQRDARHPCGVVEDVANGHTLLAVGAEFWPQLGDPGVVAERPALGQHVDQGRGRRLAHRVAVDGRLRRKRPSACRIRDPRHGIDDLLAALIDGDLEASLGPRFHHLVDGLLDVRLKAARCCLAHVSLDDTGP